MDTSTLQLDNTSRTKLDGIVQQMDSQNASDQDIQAIVDDFKQKYGKPPDPNQSTGGGFLDTLGNIGAGTVNFINNNPISRGINSLAALPVQGLAKVMGKPDPFAGGIGGSSLGAFAPVGVTSSPLRTSSEW